MAQNVKFDTLRTLAYTSITSSYVAVGTPTTVQARIICITNTCDKAVTFSTDGSTDMLIIPSGSFKLFDLTNNRANVDQVFVVPAHTQFYVKQVAAPGSGAVYVEVVYAA